MSTKKALLLFNKDALPRDFEDMYARNCEQALAQMFPNTEWLVRSGTEDGEMRMYNLGITPDGNGWKSYFNRWMKDVFTPDSDGDLYSAFICGHSDGGLGRANATIAEKMWTTVRYSGGFLGMFVLNDDGSLRVARAFQRGQQENWAGVCGRLS